MHPDTGVWHRGVWHRPGASVCFTTEDLPAGPNGVAVSTKMSSTPAPLRLR